MTLLRSCKPSLERDSLRKRHPSAHHQQHEHRAPVWRPQGTECADIDVCKASDTFVRRRGSTETLFEV